MTNPKLQPLRERHAESDESYRQLLAIMLRVHAMMALGMAEAILPNDNFDGGQVVEQTAKYAKLYSQVNGITVKAAFSKFLRANSLLTAVLIRPGVRAEHILNEGGDPLNTLESLIKDFGPVIDSMNANFGTEAEYTAQDIVEAFKKIKVGESPRLFKARPRVGKEVNTFSVNKLRFEAFTIRSHLRDGGLKAAVICDIYQNHVSHKWDSVRKWDRAARSVIDEETQLQIAKQVADLFANSKEPLEVIAKNHLSKIRAALNEARTGQAS